MIGAQSRFGSARVWRDLVKNLTLRDLRGQYNRSALGWAWSILNPLSLIVVYALVFSLFLRVEPPVGDPSGLHSFPFFLVAGLIPWTFLAVGLSRSAESITGNQSLVTKVYFPRSALPSSIVASAFVTFCVEMLVVMVFYLFGHGPQVLVWMPVVALIMLLQLAFVLGLGILVSVANVYFRDVQHLITVGLQPWFFLTPIIYPASVEALSRSLLGISGRQWLNINPMTHFVEAYHSALYDLRWPSPARWAAMIATVIVVWAVAISTYRRLEPRLAEEL